MIKRFNGHDDALLNPPLYKREQDGTASSWSRRDRLINRPLGLGQGIVIMASSSSSLSHKSPLQYDEKSP